MKSVVWGVNPEKMQAELLAYKHAVEVGAKDVKAYACERREFDASPLLESDHPADGMVPDKSVQLQFFVQPLPDDELLIDFKMPNEIVGDRPNESIRCSPNGATGCSPNGAIP